MRLDLEKLAAEAEGEDGEKDIPVDRLRAAFLQDVSAAAEEVRRTYADNYDGMTLVDIYSSGQTPEDRKASIKELMRAGIKEGTIQSVVRPDISDEEMEEKKISCLEMYAQNA